MGTFDIFCTCLSPYHHFSLFKGGLSLPSCQSSGFKSTYIFQRVVDNFESKRADILVQAEEVYQGSDLI